MAQFAATLLAAALGVASCGGGGDGAASPRAEATARSPEPSGQPTACVKAATDLAAPGPYAVRSAATAMRRRSGAIRAQRAIDPVVWYPARSRRGCRIPLILFSHGNNGAPAGCSELCGHMASLGFVVLAPLHADRDTPRRLQAPERVEDLTYLLDHLPLIWRRLAPALAGRVDGRVVGVAGHSFGGRSAAELASQDERTKALLTMAGGADQPTTALIRAPTLMLAGGADSVDPARLTEASARALPRFTPHGVLVIAGAGHGAFTDGCVAAETCTVVKRSAAALSETYLAHRRGSDGPLRALGFR